MKRIFITILPFLFLSWPAQALLEVAVGYGGHSPTDTSQGDASLKIMHGWNIDAIGEIPMVPVGLGLRYETMGMALNQLAQNSSTTRLNRLSALVNYRLIDMIAYLGFIGTLGLSSKIRGKIFDTMELDYRSPWNFSLGLEGGVNFGFLGLGGELGYNFAKYKSEKSVPTTLDMNGLYFKVMARLDL